MLAGFGDVVITPPLGLHMQGYFAPRVAEGIKDHLYSRALVVSQDDRHVAVVVTDLIDVLPEDVTAVKRLVEERLGIPGSNVLIAASHTHTGPAVNRRPGFQRDETYMQTWAKLTAGAVELAFRCRVPATVAAGKGSLPGVSFNRRFRMKHGYVHTNPGKGNPDIESVAGPVDTDVTVLRFDGPDGVPIGILTHFGCHCDTVGGNYYSADWVGVAADGIRRLMEPFAGGRSFGVVVMPGACGDINHVDVFDPERRKRWPDHTRELGLGVAAETVRVAVSLHPEPVASVNAAAANLQVEFMPIAEFERRSRAALDDPRVGRMEKRRAEANLRDLDYHAQLPRSVNQEIVCLRIGSALIASGPGEMFCELGLAFKRAFPDHVGLIANLANGYLGYIPTAEAFAEGGYEQMSARVKPGTGEALVEAAVNLGKKLLGRESPTSG